MAWDEWEQLKAAAAEKHSTRLQLNGIPPEDTPGTGDLKVNQTDLAAVGNSAFKLYERLWDKGRVALPGSDRAATDLRGQGFELGSALRHVSKRWSKQLRSLTDACAHISNHLDFTKNAHQGDEYDIKHQLSSITMLDKGFDDDYAPKGKRNEADN
ncbi:hypothetical protein [Streptomyces sp. NPDC059452]|uniref:hypothetical protein n=1 Tax=Streptomyces sp. NPDC059452 TaxID=3346835 RepID=UPI0036C581CA